MTANHELPIPAEVWKQLGLQPGAEFDVRAEQDRLIVIRATAANREDFQALMARLEYVRPGRRFERDEANER
jgi:antitoxin component of MazEF toxin-antitoxin module